MKGTFHLSEKEITFTRYFAQVRNVQPELVMGSITSAHYHWDRAVLFRGHAEHARLAETREMYLRLARTEGAMAELAERRRQSEVVAVEQWALPFPQDPKKPNGED